MLDGFGAPSVSMVPLSRLVRQLAVVAFAGLPAAPVEGMLFAVTDSNSTVRNAIAAGGGANHVVVRFDGTNWLVM